MFKINDCNNAVYQMYQYRGIPQKCFGNAFLCVYAWHFVNTIVETQLMALKERRYEELKLAEVKVLSFSLEATKMHQRDITARSMLWREKKEKRKSRLRWFWGGTASVWVEGRCGWNWQSGVLEEEQGDLWMQWKRTWSQLEWEKKLESDDGWWSAVHVIKQVFHLSGFYFKSLIIN